MAKDHVVFGLGLLFAVAQVASAAFQAQSGSVVPAGSVVNAANPGTTGPFQANAFATILQTNISETADGTVAVYSAVAAGAANSPYAGVYAYFFQVYNGTTFDLGTSANPFVLN